ncbi:MAG: roadblock/LC7 domain-containing protein [Microthrixaceae bacterium]|nr:roadblock/LC7 domain-containing protein [Microthrixaceae bacterium]MCO5312828.1 roadblock/LC7 domain-containing protein [Microthrixaceae bacterium]HPB45509.1 roadblock/LC7 domain-containing protein [Microthrixaceae bacterium]
MTIISEQAGNVSFLVSNFADRVPGVRDAIVLSADGLLMAMSSGMTRESADRFAAAASGLIGLAHGASAPFGCGRVTEVVIELEHGFMFVTGIGDGSSMAVVSDAGCDVGLVGYEMARLAERCGAVLTPELRAELQGALAR